jgi:hypothetical protein
MARAGTAAEQTFFHNLLSASGQLRVFRFSSRFLWYNFG